MYRFWVLRLQSFIRTACKDIQRQTKSTSILLLHCEGPVKVIEKRCRHQTAGTWRQFHSDVMYWFTIEPHSKYHTSSLVLESRRGLESGLKSILAGLGLGLGLGKICNQVHFQFSLCTFAVFSLGRMTFGQPVSYTQPKISVTYLIFTAELTRGLACSDSIYIVLIFLLLVHTAIKDLDLDLGLAVAGPSTSLQSTKTFYTCSLRLQSSVQQTVHTICHMLFSVFSDCYWTWCV